MKKYRQLASLVLSLVLSNAMIASSASPAAESKDQELFASEKFELKDIQSIFNKKTELTPKALLGKWKLVAWARDNSGKKAAAAPQGYYNRAGVEVDDRQKASNRRYLNFTAPEGPKEVHVSIEIDDSNLWSTIYELPDQTNPVEIEHGSALFAQDISSSFASLKERNKIWWGYEFECRLTPNDYLLCKRDYSDKSSSYYLGFIRNP